jgi:large subunit ribosomal protein L17
MAHHHKKAILHRYRNKNKHVIDSIVRSLIIHESINVTITRAKAVRMLVEPLITCAKRDEGSNNKLFHQLQDGEIVKKILLTLAPRYKERPGGYTRIVRTHVRSDGTVMAQIMFV